MAAHTAYPGGNVLVKAVECASPLTCRIYKGHESPLLGYVAKDGARLGSGEPAPMLGIEGRCADGCDTALAQIIVPYTGNAPPVVSSGYTEADGGMYWDIIIDDAAWHIAGNRQLLVSGGQITQIGEGRAVESDGLLAAVGEKNGRVVYAMALDASYLDYNGKTLFRYERSANYEII
jgi:hypothetical protein